ncbi:hypothetical protein [Xanthovirga aplysinae]|uniref:hypothetical protein n=1 Tax=Xanthovirga aplysinae TaxID=2529853 RepID=UPI0012BBD088|nr:hypothetical protein [Xanthovirga aplysinae]MTI29517.1 hypothetical protein [Xanthovirga aplysinae]
MKKLIIFLIISIFSIIWNKNPVNAQGKAIAKKLKAGTPLKNRLELEIPFYFGTSEINEEAARRLNFIAEGITGGLTFNRKDQIYIYGFVLNEEPELMAAREKAVMDFLKEKGVSSNFLILTAGKDEYLLNEGRKKVTPDPENRCVRFYYMTYF